MKLRLSISRWTAAYLALVAFSILGSLLSRLLRLDPGYIAPVSSVTTLAVGTIAVFSRSGVGWRQILAVLVLGTVVELVGVGTGLPFGRYRYTDRWLPILQLPSIGFFPLAVPLAWLMMVGASTLAASRVRLPHWIVAPAAGFLAALVDLAMEPAMVGRSGTNGVGQLGYWYWIDRGPLPGHAPLLNSLGWFLTATLGALVILWKRSDADTPDIDAPVVLGCHLTMVCSLGFVAGLQ